MTIDIATLGTVNLAAQPSFPAIAVGTAVPAGAEVTICATVPDNGSDHPYAGNCTDSQGNDYFLQATVGSSASLRCTGVWTSVISNPLATTDTISPEMFWVNIGQGATVRCAGIAVRGG